MPILKSGAYVAPEEITAAARMEAFCLRLVRGLRNQRRFKDARSWLQLARQAKARQEVAE